MSSTALGKNSWVPALLLATALSGFFAVRVFVSFESQRVKLVKAPIPAAEGAVLVDTSFDPRAARLAAPVAVIAVLGNPGALPRSLSLVADGQVICDVQVPPRGTKRVDCVALQGWVVRPDHLLEIRGAVGEWTLEFLEIATHHGSTTRALPFLILPDVTARFEKPDLVTIGAAWMVIGAVFLLPAAAGWRPAVVHAHRVLSGGVIVLMATMVVSPWASPFLVVMPLSAFVKASLLLLARRWWRVVQWGAELVRVAFLHRPRWRPMASAVTVTLAVALAYGAVVREALREFDGNYSGLLRVSEEGFDRSPLFTGLDDLRDSLILQPDEGYDGQFFYFAMFDPLMREFRSTPEQYRKVADAAPYRFGRIGFPLLARAVAGQRWNVYPFVMVVLVLGGVVLSAFVLARLAQDNGASPLWGLAVLAIPGFWQSIRLVLPEPLAAAFLLLGYWLVTRRHIAFAAGAFAFSLLIRETGLIFLLAIAVLPVAPRLDLKSRAWLLAAALPIAAWRLYVASGLWVDWGWEGLFFPSHNITVPFGGLIGLWAAVARGDYHPHVPELARAATWFPPLLMAVGAVSVALVRFGGWFIGLTSLAYALMAVSFTHPTVWGHVGNGQRASYEVFVLLALASVGAARYPKPLRIAIGVCWGAAALFVLFGAHDAYEVRKVLIPW